MTQTMNAMTIARYGKREPLTLRRVPVPTCGDDEVLVEIHAASVNPIDFKIRDGGVKILLNYNMPLILGNDFAGTIVQVGKNVQAFQVGDEVYGRPNKQKIGTFAEYIAVNQHDIALKPQNLTFEQAASMPLVALTAYQALTECMALQPEQKVLIHAGAGGLGTVAIQMAKLLGAYVATTASERGEALVQSLGADEVVNYRHEDFSQRLRDYDAVLDALGGETLRKSFRVVKRGGTIVSVSALPTAKFAKDNQLAGWKVVLFQLLTLPIALLAYRYQVRYQFLFMRSSRRQLQHITEWLEKGQLQPVIDRVFDFADSQQAMDYVETGRAKGKVVIKIK